MQNIGHAQNRSTKMFVGDDIPRKRHDSLLLLVAFGIACLLVVFAALMAVPSQAYAKSYSMPKVDITANAATDGSLNVVEQRTVDFDGDFTALWWTFDGLPSNAQVKINSVGLTKVDAEGVAIDSLILLPSVAFNTDWRDSGGPGKDSFSFDAPKNTMYTFFNATDERLVITLDYTVINGVQAYKDVADVYWQYIASQWEEPSENVTMTLTLPVPQGVAVVPGDNVRAWGHGPVDGKVIINEDGSITYKVAKVNSGQFAEARVVFPVGWLTNLKGESSLIHKDESHLENVLKEEQVWADQANNSRVLSLAFIIGCGVIAVVMLIWAVLMYVRYGKEHKPEFTEQYWRDSPSTDHPIVLARLWRWNREKNDDFTAELMYLSHKGAIQINKGSYEEPGTFRNKTVDDYYLTRVPEVADKLTDQIDMIALDILFNKIAQGQDSLWFGSIQQYGKDNAEDFVNALASWQGMVSAEVNGRDFFETKGTKLQMVIAGAAVVLGIAGFAVGFMTANFIPLIFVIPTVIALLVIANYMPRRSREGNNLYAKCRALQNWLKDFSALDERPPTDVKVWGVFMVFAFIFGIASEVIKALQLKVPELFQDTGSMASPAYLPWWFWYSTSNGVNGGVMPAASDMFQTSITNTVSTAQAAMSAVEGNFSSGGGFGGGFSGGGGGGFGGGGGAR